jgi:DNA polymerase-3 subunit gamma/tau
VIFVLATTEMQKILPTILSRCQVYEFRRVGVREMAAHLRRICVSEEVRISDAALERVVRSGEGSVRDALSVLERVLAFCGHEVDDDDVLRMLGGVRLEVLIELLRGLAARDAGIMLAVLDGLLDEGHDPLHFWGELISALRDLMLLRAVPGREEMLARSPGEAKALNDAAAGLTEQDLARAFQVLADLEPGLKASAQPRFLFEATLIRLASLGAVRPIEEVLLSLGGGEAVPPARAESQKKNSAERIEPPPSPKKPARSTRETGTAEQLIQAISDEKPMLGVVLEDASRISLDGGTLAIRFESGKEAMIRQIERKDSVDLLQRHAARLTGGPVRLHIGAEPVPTGAEDAPHPGAASVRPPARESGTPSRERRTARPPQREPRSALLDRARQDPGVQKLLREFGAQVVDIRPLEAAPGPVLLKNEVDTSEETP